MSSPAEEGGKEIRESRERAVEPYRWQAKEVLQANKLCLTGAVDIAWANACFNVVVKVDNIDTPGDVLRSSVWAAVPAPRLDREVLEKPSKDEKRSSHERATRVDC